MPDCGETSSGELHAGATGHDLDIFDDHIPRTTARPCPGRSFSNSERGTVRGIATQLGLLPAEADLCEAADAQAWAELAATYAAETQAYLATLADAGVVYSQDVETRVVRASIVAERLALLVPAMDAGDPTSPYLRFGPMGGPAQFDELYRSIYGANPAPYPGRDTPPQAAAVKLATYAIRELGCAQETAESTAAAQGIALPRPEAPAIPRTRNSKAGAWLAVLGAGALALFLLRR